MSSSTRRKSVGKPRKPARLQTTSKLRQLRIQAEAERETDAEVEENAEVTKSDRRQRRRLKEAGSRKEYALCVRSFRQIRALTRMGSTARGLTPSQPGEARIQSPKRKLKRRLNKENVQARQLLSKRRKIDERMAHAPSKMTGQGRPPRDPTGL